MTQRLIVGLLVLAAVMCAQHRVDPRNTYSRVICIVPIVGMGTAADPKRPQHAPWPASQDPNGIIAYSFVPTDDGKLAVAEFVALNRTALAVLLNDKSVQAFEKGRVDKRQIETAIRAVRKDFDLDKFGMVMP